MRTASLLLTATALLSTAASLNARTGDPEAPVDEIAADLSYGYCPQYLAGSFALENNATLDNLGFAASVVKKQHPRFGEVEMRSLDKADGGFAFGGASGKLCTVVAGGADLAKILQRWRHDMPMMGIAFTADAGNPSKPTVGLTAELYKGRLESGEMISIQLINAGSNAAIFQLFLSDE
jgi:hypothetical protein